MYHFIESTLELFITIVKLSFNILQKKIQFCAVQFGAIKFKARFLEKKKNKVENSIRWNVYNYSNCGWLPIMRLYTRPRDWTTF